METTIYIELLRANGTFSCAKHGEVDTAIEIEGEGYYCEKCAAENYAKILGCRVRPLDVKADRPKPENNGVYLAHGYGESPMSSVERVSDAIDLVGSLTMTPATTALDTGTYTLTTRVDGNVDNAANDG